MQQQCTNEMTERRRFRREYRVEIHVTVTLVTPKKLVSLYTLPFSLTLFVARYKLLLSPCARAVSTSGTNPLDREDTGQTISVFYTAATAAVYTTGAPLPPRLRRIPSTTAATHSRACSRPLLALRAIRLHFTIGLDR